MMVWKKCKFGMKTEIYNLPACKFDVMESVMRLLSTFVYLPIGTGTTRVPYKLSIKYSFNSHLMLVDMLNSKSDFVLHVQF